MTSQSCPVGDGSLPVPPEGQSDLDAAFFTLVFAGDIRKVVGNPHHIDTPFGRAVASGLGNAFDDLFDAEMSAECVGWVREASKRITGGNCAFVDDDLAVLEHLAGRAVEAGLTDRLSPNIQASVAALSRSQSPSDGAQDASTKASSGTNQ